MGCFCSRSQRLSAAACTRGPFRISRTPHTSLFVLFSVTFLTFVFHPSFQTHRGRSAPDGCLKAESVEAAAALQPATSVIMGCLGLQGRAGRNACTCVRLSYLVFHTCSLCLRQPGRTIHLKYSGGCRNALINTVALQPPVLCIYEAEPSRFGQICWQPVDAVRATSAWENPSFFFKKKVV